MRYRRLAAAGVDLSELALGASPLGGMFGPVDRATAVATVRTALELGVNTIDVAPYYGDTLAETVLGDALRGVDRDTFVLSTKVGRYGRRTFDFSARRVRDSVHESLARLGVEHLDVVYCHDIEFAERREVLEEALPALDDLRRAGHVRAVGISGLPLPVIEEVASRAGSVDAVMSYGHYTLACNALARLVPSLARRGVQVLNAAPLGMGLFTPGVLPPWHPAAPRLRAAARLAADRAGAHGTPITELALAFALGAPGVLSTVVGASSPAEVRANVAVAGTRPPPAALAAALAALRAAGSPCAPGTCWPDPESV